MTTDILTEAEILHDMVTKCLPLADRRKTTHWGAVKCEFCERPAQGGDWRAELCHKCAQDSLCETWRDDEGNEERYGD